MPAESDDVFSGTAAWKVSPVLAEWNVVAVAVAVAAVARLARRAHLDV